MLRLVNVDTCLKLIGFDYFCGCQWLFVLHSIKRAHPEFACFYEPVRLESLLRRLHLPHSLNLTGLDCCSYDHFRSSKDSCAFCSLRYGNLRWTWLHVRRPFIHDSRGRLRLLSTWRHISEFTTSVSLLDYCILPIWVRFF